MNSEEQIRALLTRAAALPDQVQPPVQQLVSRARRRRARRTVYSVCTVAAVTAAAFALPPAIRALGPGGLTPPATGSLAGLFPAHPVRLSPGPAADQLARYRWSSLPPSPLGPRSQPLLAWTGRALVELGGSRKGVTQDDGAVYTPATGKWRLVPHPKGNVGFSNAVDVWTGHQLFVANGQVASGCLPRSDTACLPHAGLYDPAANRWFLTRLPGQMDRLTLTSAVWTGRVVILAGVNSSPRHARLSVAAYDPVTNRWRMITPALPAGHPPVAAAMVAVPGRILLWSLWSRTTKISGNGYAVASGLDVLSLGRHGGWQAITGAWPQHKVVQNPVYANRVIFIPPGQIWCGRCSHPPHDYPAELVSPTSLARRTLPDGPLVAHPGVQPPIWLWNGRAALAANTGSPAKYQRQGPVGWLAQLAVYDPHAHHWTVLTVPQGHPPIAASPVWAGRDLLLLTSSGSLLSFHA